MEHPTATKTKSSEGFIDGDLVEHFLDLPEKKMAEICKGIKVMYTVANFLLVMLILSCWLSNRRNSFSVYLERKPKVEYPLTPQLTLNNSVLFHVTCNV